MSWTYSQSRGELLHNGIVVDRDTYSGHGAGKNNSAMQAVRAVGPIPQGSYRISAPRHSNRVGNYAMPLTPEAGTNTFGRSAFFIHGDSRRQPGTASEGCVVTGYHTRHIIWASGDHELKVVP